MGSVCGWSDDDERSVIGEKGELPFIDYQEDKSVCNYEQNDDDPFMVSAPFPFVDGVPQSVIIGVLAKDSITIKNNTDEEVDIWSISIYASEPEDSFKLSVKDPSPSDSSANSAQGFYGTHCLEERVLPPGQTLTVWLSVKPESIGTYRTAVHVNIGSETIERVAILMVDNKISQSLASNRPYSRVLKKKRYEASTSNYVRGVRPVRTDARSFKKRLPMYQIPKEIRELVADKQIPDALQRGLTRENYISFFHTLLNLEELQLEEDMRAFNMECVCMRRKGSHYLTLEVPGLAERRPSVVSGDSVFVRPNSEYGKDEKFEGVVHRVEADEIYMKFAKDFHNCHMDGNLYNVEFTYNRTNMRRLYAAIEGAREQEMTLLFPSEFSKKRWIRTTPLIPISCMLNEEQMCAIEMILGCRGMPPYVIHGPPGTGKTMTIVEGILQLYRMGKHVRILVCTPSNSAADHILEKLISEAAAEMKEGEVFRLNAASRSPEEVKPEFMPFCFFDEAELLFKCPALNALRRCRIIISTYMSASHLLAEGLKRGHFSHIFLDEAGQASEPETMIPLSNICQKETVVVLAGDPKQLGPIVHSKTAEAFGLGKSYLERLFESEKYSCGDENYVTRLVRNYRCHPQILHLPSELFYGGELQACRDDASYLNLCNDDPCWDFFPNKDFPILFMGIQGCDEREGNNPSWFNRIEASKVVEVIEMLTGSGKLREEDIGVITPYRQQVLKLKKAFDSLGMSEIKIGSVEQFQGQERQAMVVSTVRSTVKHNEFDRVHCLGFLSNPRRFNVAVTRAISLLVIVGNPHIICKDPYWNKLLWHCVDNDSYKGCTLPDRDELPIYEPVQSQFRDDWKQENSQCDDNGGKDNWEPENSQFNGGSCGWEVESKKDDEWEEQEKPQQRYYGNGNGNGWEQSKNDDQVANTNEDEWSDGWKS